MIHYLASGIISVYLVLIAYEDYKFSKIYNHRVISIFMVGIFYFLISGAWWYFNDFSISNDTGANWYLFVLALKSLTVSLILSYALWHYKFWSAGDAKLFVALSFSFPIYFYQKAILITFPALSLLTNILFFPFLLVLIRFLFFPLYYGYFVIKNPAVIKKYKIRKPKLSREELKDNLILFLAIAFMFIFYRIIRWYFGQYWGNGWHFDNYWFIAGYLILIFLYHHFRSFCQKNNLALFLAIPVIIYFIVIYFIKPATSGLDMLVIFGHSLILLTLIRLILFLYNFYENFMEKKVVLTKDLKPGMMIDTSIAKNITYQPLSEYLDKLDHLISDEEIKDLQKLWLEYEENISNAYKKYSVAKFFYLTKAMTDDEIVSNLPIRKHDLVNLNYDPITNFINKFTDQQLLNELEISQLKSLVQNYYKSKMSADIKPVDLQIHKSICFGIWFLIGILITIFIQGSIVYWIIKILKTLF